MKDTKTSEEFGPVERIGEGVASAYEADGTGLGRLVGRRESAASAMACKRRRALGKGLGALAVATTAVGPGMGSIAPAGAAPVDHFRATTTAKTIAYPSQPRVVGCPGTQEPRRRH